MKDIIRPGVDYMAFQARERREEAERAKKVEGSLRPPAYSYPISARTGRAPSPRCARTWWRSIVLSWQDILALEGNRDWWLGITAAGMRWRRAHSAQNISKSLWPLVERTMRRSDMLITPTRRCWLGSWAMAAAAATLETAA